MHLKTNLTGRLGRWSAEHPWRAIGTWLVLVVLAVLAGKVIGTATLNQNNAGVGSSGRAQVTATHAFPAHATEQVLVHSPALTAGQPSFRAAVADVIDRVQGTGRALNLQSPYAPGNAGQVSRDGHSALIQFDVTGSTSSAGKRVAPILAAVAAAAHQHPSLSIEEAGAASIAKANDDTLGRGYVHAEELSVPITLFVLLFAFGALVAALLPVALALTAVGGATGLLAFVSHLTPVDQAASSVLLLVGMAVGVDYSLFYVKREREERAAGAGPQAALRAAAATSGHSVLISGITVLIAMAGMFLAGDPTFTGVGWAAMLVVAIAMIGSLTVLPAMLSLLGDRVERGRIPLLSRLRHADRNSHADRNGRGWGLVLDKVLRRPIIAVTLSAGALIALALPVLHMHTASPDASDLPQNLPVLQTYNRIQATFPGGPTPAQVVIKANDVTTPAVRHGITALEHAALATGQMSQPIYTRTSADHTVAVVSIPLAGNGENAASARALHTLRDQVIPATIARVPGTSINVGGPTASNSDFNALMSQRVPIVFGFVLLLAFALLLVSFRSIVVAVKAIVLNLLSVGAAYGVLVWIFQDGHGQRLLHFHSTHAIASWLPLFMFVLLFGLSMDYHVFILSRIREAFQRGEPSERAVTHGIKSTAGTVTAAAVVMVMVFLTFASLSLVSMKEAGVGLATAVLLDATLVRIVLLPATMKLLGDWNWYLPRWLEWLPSLGHAKATRTAGTPAPAPLPTPDTGPPVLVGSSA